MTNASACVRFSEPCRDNPLELMGTEYEYFLKNKDIPACHECQQDIYLGFFFDGTNNNKFRDTKGFSHSNVARLYEAYIGTPAYQQIPTLTPKFDGWNADGSVKTKAREIFEDQPFKPQDLSEKEFPYYRKIYVAGVGTPFPEVGDSGTGMDKTLGLGMAAHGEARLAWAMLQVGNQIHAAITGQPIRKSFDIEIKKWPRRPEDIPAFLSDLYDQLYRQLDILEEALAKAVKKREGKKPSLRRVRMTIMGFSRGAAEARAFATRVVRRWDGHICGLPLSIDFMGIFDTVASVGLAQSVPRANGHSAWADGDNMVIPSQVKRCVHLVSAHEVRASFPLDSICQGGALAANCKEIVYPGMHSDIGGGYPPGDQGRSLGQGAAGDCKKLSQIPLAQMYREARMAGVPLGAPGQFYNYQKTNFKIDPQLRTDFNAYVEATRTGRVPPANSKNNPAYAELYPTEEQPRYSIDTLLFTHYAHFLQWHKQILGRAHELPGMQANPNVTKYQDIEDIRGADEELQKELRFLEDKNPRKFEDVDDPVMGTLLNGSLATGSTAYLAIRKGLLETMHQKQNQWDYGIKEVWYGKPMLTGQRAADVRKLFECYVHDSRAWFKALVSQYKPTPESKIALLNSVLQIGSYGMAPDDEDWFTLGGRDKQLKAEIADLEARLAKQKADKDWLGQQKTEEKLASLKEQGPLIHGGREPYRMYGYLRHRKIYQTGQLDAAETRTRIGQIEQDEKESRKQERIAEENARYEKAKGDALKANHEVIKASRDTPEYREGAKATMRRLEEEHASNLRDIAQGN